MTNRFRAHKARNEPFTDPSNDSLTALLALHREEIAKIRSGSIFFAFSAFFSIFTTLIRDESFSDSIRRGRCFVEWFLRFSNDQCYDLSACVGHDISATYIRTKALLSVIIYLTFCVSRFKSLCCRLCKRSL